MPSLNLNFWVEVQIFQIIQILQYMSQGNKKFPSIYWRDLFSRKKSCRSNLIFLFYAFFLGYQGPFWQPNSPSLLSFCFFHQFDCYDVIDYCRNNCPQFTGCGTYFISLHLISGLPTLPFWFVPNFSKMPNCTSLKHTV